jgi:hypothetical protein
MTDPAELKIATIRLMRNALSSSDDWTMASYHRREKPRHGRASKGESWRENRANRKMGAHRAPT